MALEYTNECDGVWRGLQARAHDDCRACRLLPAGCRCRLGARARPAFL